nr:MAG TPA: hypothetical protein [Caudoviricetes sp.]
MNFNTAMVAIIFVLFLMEIYLWSQCFTYGKSGEMYFRLSNYVALIMLIVASAWALNNSF